MLSIIKIKNVVDKLMLVNKIGNVKFIRKLIFYR